MKRGRSKKARKRVVAEKPLETHFPISQKQLQRRSDLLGELLEERDEGALVLAHLSVSDLLRCSQVCRRLLKAIDASKNSSFNEQLRWWVNYSHAWASTHYVVQCDRGAYKTDIDVEDVDVQCGSCMPCRQKARAYICAFACIFR